MMYRCRACQYECYRGWLPGVTCGLYFIFLLVVAAGLLSAAMWAVRVFLLPERPPPVQPEPTPWWLYPSLCGGSIVLGFGGAAALHWLLELTEYLIVCRHPCPHCGAKGVSRGYTRGFGL